ncbi:MAG TPA: class I mannose-6-phosphate isomerase [Pseudonocardiaceae bacterium]|jgi:mannose-6-phosphate isomerase|nr:class I mannose-6-phosphate isomerase [Pseudonocardiaceae bacterium]
MNVSPSSTAAPIVLPANQPHQFYRGGAAIAELRGVPAGSDFGPEDWVASTTARFGKETDGLSKLPDGSWLRDAVTADPEGWLGAAHLTRFGADTALLVKLLDAGQRLPVHCHPSDDFANTNFGSHFGKTEAWVVVGTSGAKPTVHIGFQRDVDRAQVDSWVADQDREAMLGALNEVPVAAGDTVFVSAGLPHAIGAGVFIVELQQPTDLSITLEWDGFLDGESAGHLGFGFDVALGCLDRSGWGDGRWESLVRHTGGNTDPVVDLFGANSTNFFRADRVQASRPVELEASFSVFVVLDGNGRLITERGGALELRRGESVVVPFGAGASTVEGAVTAVRCRPPAV